MSGHAYRPSAWVRLGVKVSCIAAALIGVAVGVFLMLTQGTYPGLVVLLIGVPILIGLVAAVATLLVTPLKARDFERQMAEDEQRQRVLLGHEVLITHAVARFFHPVPAAHVPLGAGEVTAYSTGYLAFDALGDRLDGYYRTRTIDGWHQQAEGEFLLECSPLYQIAVHTAHAPEWRAWLTQFHGPSPASVVIDLSTVEEPASELSADG
jgi:hypothetical protein